MNHSCIIKPHHAGLFSMINKVITCAELYPQWWVDWAGGTIYSKPGEDLWASLFGAGSFASAPYSLDDADIITEYPHQRYTYKEAEGVYKDKALRVKLNAIWQNFRAKPDIVREAFDFAIEHFGQRPVIGALVRAHTHRGEQLNDRSQELQEYVDALMDWHMRQRRYCDGRDERLALYVMAGDLETIAWFKEHTAGVDVVYHPATKRLATRDIDRHLSVPQTLADARQVMVETMALALCRAIIHPVSNIATAALVMNPAAESIFLP